MTSIALAVDETQVATILAHKLRREGYLVERIAGAPAFARQEPYDIAIAEPHLIDAPAIATLRQGWLALIANEERHSQGPHLMRMGAAGIVCKPFKPSAVAEQVAWLSRMRR